MGALSRLKDLTVSRLALAYLNHHFKSLGHMTTLRIDSESHTLEISADLIGETQPIEAKVAYRLEEQDGAMTFVPTKVECSRPWMEMLAAQMLASAPPRVKVPDGLPSTLVKMLKL